MIKKPFCKCWINVRKEPDTYTGTSLKVRLLPNTFSVASARRDERESRESRPGGEANFSPSFVNKAITIHV